MSKIITKCSFYISIHIKLALLMSISFPAMATTYWVDTNGSDLNNCTSENTACKTLGKAIPLATIPGDIVNIKSGVYSETQSDCQYFSVPAIACLNGSGTQTKPIIIQAAPNHEGNVTLDGNTNKAGIHLKGHDYVVIQNLEITNMHTVGIYNGGPPVTNVNDDSDFSVGVQILNNVIHNVRSVNRGSNPGGIRMDNAKDWIVRNNAIHTVCGLADEGGCRYINAGCIYSYYIWNATVENNECSNSGALVHWKDHILDANGEPTLFGSLARYNIGYDLTYGFYISHGNRDPESSNHTVTHNIFYNIDSACLSLITDTANGALSINYIFEHNICDGADVGILSYSAQVTRSQGNIFTDITGYPTPTIADIYRFRLNETAENTHARLDYSDYNIFADSTNNALKFPRVNMNDPNSNHLYHNLLNWQAALGSGQSGPLSLTMSRPDNHSIEANESSLFINSAQRDYHHATNSSAVGLMPNGTNAGPYQIGNETIGLLSQNSPSVNQSEGMSILDIIPSIIGSLKTNKK